MNIPEETYKITLLFLRKYYQAKKHFQFLLHQYSLIELTISRDLYYNLNINYKIHL
jgi:hypothetical protein